MTTKKLKNKSRYCVYYMSDNAGVLYAEATRLAFAESIARYLSEKWPETKVIMTHYTHKAYGYFGATYDHVGYCTYLNGLCKEAVHDEIEVSHI